MSDKCPECGAATDEPMRMRYEKTMECGTRLIATEGPACWEVAYQSDRCRIVSLERKLAVAVEALEQIDKRGPYGTEPIDGVRRARRFAAAALRQIET